MTATAISMASVANDIPASGPKPLGGCQVFITVLPPHRAVSDASHAVHPDAITEETFAFDFAIVWVHGPEDQLVTAKGLNVATCRKRLGWNGKTFWDTNNRICLGSAPERVGRHNQLYRVGPSLRFQRRHAEWIPVNLYGHRPRCRNFHVRA